METCVGDIILFAGNFEIDGFLECKGQLLSIEQYSTLFAILGVQYGGDGRRTFALPKKTPLTMGQTGNYGGGKYLICINGYFPRRS